MHTFYPDRGEIYDRSGHLLAGNKTVFEVGVNLDTMESADALALALESQLGIAFADTRAALLDPPEALSFLVVADFVDLADTTALQHLRESLRAAPAESAGDPLRGLEFKPHPQRSYPEGPLASNVLGFVSREGRGYFGVEEKYDALLAGNPVRLQVPTDPHRATEIPQVPDGTTLILSISRDLQSAAEQILDQALGTFGADGGTIIVMDPQNGEVLAMAATPRMDLNRFWNYPVVYRNASEFNLAASMPYEPGSVLKVLTMAAALESGTVTPGTQFLDTGQILVGGATIRNWNGEAWGVQDMTGCMQHSLNVCLAWVATQMGAHSFYGSMDRFGLGHPTGIDLAGEAAGRLKVPGDADWYPVDLGTNAFGQGVAVTPVQMLMAASSIANEGRTVTPHLVRAMVRDGRQYSVPAQYAGSPISAETASTLAGMLATSLEEESSMALVPGYRVAGKTGTAQIPTPFGSYDDSGTNASFIGWGPVDDPRFMIYVWLMRPSTSIWGSETAAPTFAQMASKTVLLMDIPPDSVRRQLAASQ
jgi:cell division protein FtsI/penicillin-binding protein 2